MSDVNVTRYMSTITKVNTRVKGNAAPKFKASMKDGTFFFIHIKTVSEYLLLIYYMVYIVCFILLLLHENIVYIS